MRIYLVQHGEAVPKEVDPDRPLSQAGQEVVEAMARLLAEAGMRVPRALHSGKLRARQTADILAARLTPEESAVEMEGLAPNDPVEPVVRRLSNESVDLMMVGHLPFMSKLVSRLVAGNEDLTMVTFVPGTVVCVEAGDGGSYSIAWMLGPELAVGTGG